MPTAFQRSFFHRTSLAGALALVVGAGAVHAQEARFNFDIPRESLSNALRDFARQSHQQLIFTDDLTAGKTAPAIRGAVDADEALHRLLAGSGLDAQRTPAGALIIKRVAGTAPPPGPPKNAEAALNEGAAEPEPNVIATVIVTAEKRSESELQVPMAMTTLSGEDLVRNQSYRLEDFVGTVPGLNLINYGGYGSQLVIRGLSTGLGAVSGTVAAYIDDTPFTSNSPFLDGPWAAPNLETFDMARIEVLKGPQGTLYGANAMGGLVKFVTNAPDPSRFSSTLEAGVSSVYNGGAGYDLHGMINVPIADDMAFRVVAYQNYYPGYIDDPSRGLRDDNEAHYSGGRVEFLYHPVSNFSIKLTALYQIRSFSDQGFATYMTNSEGGDVRPQYGQLISEQAIAQPGNFSQTMGNILINWDFGWAHLTSSSSYSVSRNSNTYDLTSGLAPVVASLCTFLPCSPISNPDVGLASEYDFNEITQEVRFESRSDQKVTWIVGAFYQDVRGNEFNGPFAVDPTTRQPLLPTFTIAGLPLGYYHNHPSYLEWAGFGDVTWHATPTISLDVGGRYSHNSQDFRELGTGFLGCDCAVNRPSAQGVFTYSTDAKWQITPNQMVYGRIAEGFVPGGPNNVILLKTGLSPTYNSSTSTNYEIGYKATLLGNRLNIELAAYDIAWRDIQLLATFEDEGTLTNGGSATSKGVEWSFTYIPFRGLTLGFNGSYDDAYLTQNTPEANSIGAFAGNRLPADPFWSGSASADYETPIFGDYSGFVGISYQFTGTRYTDFAISNPRTDLPSNGIVDIHGGIENRRYTFEVYIKNLANEIEPTYLGYGSFPLGDEGAVTVPRTIGATLTARF